MSEFEKWYKENEPFYVWNDNIRAAWQAATAVSDKRIAELLRDYKAQSDFDEEMIKIDTKTITELQAHINVLREALEEINNQNISLEKHGVAMTYFIIQAIKTLEITPAQSLIQHDNEVIERCAVVCDGYTHGAWFADKIRALKG